jgi:hypothetical protein
MLGSSGVAAQLAGSQEGLSFMSEWVSEWQSYLAGWNREQVNNSPKSGNSATSLYPHCNREQTRRKGAHRRNTQYTLKGNKTKQQNHDIPKKGEQSKKPRAKDNSVCCFPPLYSGLKVCWFELFPLLLSVEAPSGLLRTLIHPHLRW